MALACMLIAAPARAGTPGVTLDRIDVTLEIPDPAKDSMLQTRHTIVLYAQTASMLSKLSLGIAPLVVRATEATTGAPVSTTRRVGEDDAFTDITLPSGVSQVKLEFTAPLFEGAIPRFWWDETQIVLGWPFAPALVPLTQGMSVTVLAPLSFGRPPGFSCVNEAGRLKCSRFFGPAELSRYKDTKAAGLPVAAIPADDPMPIVVSAGQIGLWCVLLVAFGFWRIARPLGPTGKRRISMFVLTVLAVVILAVSLIAFALVIDGETDGPLAASMSWASGVFGVTALMLAHLDNEKRPWRNRLGQLMLAAAMPFGVAVSGLASDDTAGLWVVGGIAFTAFMVMYGESKE